MGDLNYLEGSVDDEATSKLLMYKAKEYATQLSDKAFNIMKLEDELRDAKEDYKQLEQVTIPNYYNSIGIQSLTLADGRVVSIKEQIKCSLTTDIEKRNEVFEWLRDNGGEELITREVYVPDEYRDKIVNMGIPIRAVESVNTSSVKAFLADKLGKKASVATVNVEDVPKGIGLYIYNQAIIK